MDNYCPSFYEWPLSIRHRMTARAVGAVRRLAKRKWVVDLHIPWLHCDGFLGTVGKPRFGRIWGAPRMSMSRRVTLPTCHPEDPNVWRQVYNFGFCPFLPVDRVPLSLQGAKKGEKATFSRQSEVGKVHITFKGTKIINGSWILNRNTGLPKKYGMSSKFWRENTKLEFYAQWIYPLKIKLK